MLFYVWHYMKSNICMGRESASEDFFKGSLDFFSITSDCFSPQFPVVNEYDKKTEAESLEHLFSRPPDITHLQQTRTTPTQLKEILEMEKHDSMVFPHIIYPPATEEPKRKFKTSAVNFCSL